MNGKKFSLSAVLLGQGIGVSAALGLYCLLTFLSCFVDGSVKEHPVAFPLSILLGLACLAAVGVLFVSYIRIRKRTPSAFWTVVDVLLGLTGMAAYFPLIVFIMR